MLTRGKRRANALILAALLMSAALPVCAAELGGTLRHLIASARTKADQERIAWIYEAQVARAREEVAKHQSLADYYRGNEADGGRSGSFGQGSFAQMAVHCESLVELYAKVADENTKLAEMHRKMAAEMK